MWLNLGAKLLELLVPIITAAIVALIGYGVAFLRAKTEALRLDVARQSLLAALSEAEKVARDAVMATNQVFVDNLKQGKADGKLSAEDAKAALDKAKEYFIGTLSRESISVLEAAVGPVQEWLGRFLEAKLYELKGGTAAEVYKAANPT